jgi:hypothetical protein
MLTRRPAMAVALSRRIVWVAAEAAQEFCTLGGGPHFSCRIDCFARAGARRALRLPTLRPAEPRNSRVVLREARTVRKIWRGG